MDKLSEPIEVSHRNVGCGMADSFDELLSFVVCVAIMVPSSPGFIGVLEGSCVVGLSLLGVDASRALAYGVLYHLTQIAPLVILGGFYALRGTIRPADLEKVGGFSYTPEEIAFAEEIRKTLTEPATIPIGSQEKVQPSRTGAVGTASTDLADVSWNVPTVSMTAATFVPGVPAHSWQATACAGGTIGMKGMMVAAKTMALTSVDLFTDATLVQKAKAEFDQKRGPGFVYKTRLADRKPALDYRK